MLTEVNEHPPFTSDVNNKHHKNTVDELMNDG